MLLDTREWLETDGLGGYAMGTASGVRTRRYHGLLITATTPPTGRMMLVNGFDARVELPSGVVHVSTQRYVPDVLHPDGIWRLDPFIAEPWPTWRWRLTADADLIQEVFMPNGAPRVVVRWRVTGRLPDAQLVVRPLISCRDHHALHHENPACRFDVVQTDDHIEWHPYESVAGVRSRSNGSYHHAPEWYRQFLYLEERNRGLDETEDLASPGELRFDLSRGDAVWVLEATTLPVPAHVESPIELVTRLRVAELERRRAFPSALHRSADQFVVKRGNGNTIVAGYPWFTDWGRDTFIALRGLCLSTGRLVAARRILLEWADAVSEGMLPNRFPDGEATPEFNAVDASLWFIIAVEDLLRVSERGRGLTETHRRRLMRAVDDILSAYSNGTRFGIRGAQDGLLAAGVPGMQLTWMDAKVGGEVITPRIGKPVEIQALWLNALAFAGRESEHWRTQHARGLAAFQAKFWNEQRACLFDVVDVDHFAGRTDGSMRPNQIFAVGGLPQQILRGPRARQVVDAVEHTLLTPRGLRSLAAGEPGYTPRYGGPPEVRDRSYHQGVAWPWLIGAFVDAWSRVRGDTPDVRREARDRFIRPLLGELDRLGFGHLPEITDGEAPFAPRGCPFQAWSVGELLRLASQP